MNWSWVVLSSPFNFHFHSKFQLSLTLSSRPKERSPIRVLKRQRNIWCFLLIVVMFCMASRLIVEGITANWLLVIFLPPRCREQPWWEVDSNWGQSEGIGWDYDTGMKLVSFLKPLLLPRASGENLTRLKPVSLNVKEKKPVAPPKFCSSSPLLSTISQRPGVQTSVSMNFCHLNIGVNYISIPCRLYIGVNELCHHHHLLPSKSYKRLESLMEPPFSEISSMASPSPSYNLIKQ